MLDGIRTVEGDAGVLLIVKSYTGDRLNFGLAAELARAADHGIDLVRLWSGLVTTSLDMAGVSSPCCPCPPAPGSVTGP